MGLLTRAREFGSGTRRLMRGVADFRRTGVTPHESYMTMRHFYCHTRGYSNQLLSSFLQTGPGACALPGAKGVLGDLGAPELAAIAESLHRNGYHHFDARLPADMCDRLTAFALQTECAPTPRTEGMPERVRYERGRPEAVAYHLGEQELCDNRDIQALAADLSLLSVARAYLGCTPILDLITSWWSTAFGKTASSEVAQLYHFDMDRLKFLKFFIYLTDVTPQNGPHVYVKGSHRRGGKPAELWRRGPVRIPDADVERHYPAEDIVKVCRPRGSIFAGDTSAFHKGTVVEQGDRLVLEIEFCNSLFGAPFTSLTLGPDADPTLLQRVEQCPIVYSKFSVRK